MIMFETEYEVPDVGQEISINDGMDTESESDSETIVENRQQNLNFGGQESKKPSNVPLVGHGMNLFDMESDDDVEENVIRGFANQDEANAIVNNAEGAVVPDEDAEENYDGDADEVDYDSIDDDDDDGAEEFQNKMAQLKRDWELARPLIMGGEHTPELLERYNSLGAILEQNIRGAGPRIRYGVKRNETAAAEDTSTATNEDDVGSQSNIESSVDSEVWGSTSGEEDVSTASSSEETGDESDEDSIASLIKDLPDDAEYENCASISEFTVTSTSEEEQKKYLTKQELLRRKETKFCEKLHAFLKRNEKKVKDEKAKASSKLKVKAPKKIVVRGNDPPHEGNDISLLCPTKKVKVELIAQL